MTKSIDEQIDLWESVLGNASRGVSKGVHNATNVHNAAQKVVEGLRQFKAAKELDINA